VAYKFKADYEEKLQPLKEKLLPAMVKYEDYLKDLAGLSDVYTENSSPSLSALKAAAVGAGIVGAAAVVGGEIGTKNITYVSNSSKNIETNMKEGSAKINVKYPLGDDINVKASVEGSQTVVAGEASIESQLDGDTQLTTSVKGEQKEGRPATIKATKNIRYQGDNTEINANIEGAKTDGKSATVTGGVSVEQQMKEDTKVTANVEGAKTNGQPATVTGKVGVEEQIRENTKVVASVEGTKTDGQPATIIGGVNVEQQIREDTKVTASVESAKTDGQPAIVTGKMKAEQKIGKNITAYAEGEISQTKGQSPTGKGKAGVEYNIGKDAKITASGEVTEKAVTGKVSASIPLGKQGNNRVINSNKLTEEDIKVLNLNNIYPTMFEIFTSTRDKYKDLLNN
jgi:hypothetical protein